MTPLMVATFVTLRDTAKPVMADLTPRTAANPDLARAGYDRDTYDLREVRSFTPPSKAHIKRLKRNHEPASEPTSKSERPAWYAGLNHQLALMNKMLRDEAIIERHLPAYNDPMHYDSTDARRR